MVAVSTLTLFAILGSVELSRNDRKIFSCESGSKLNHLIVDKNHEFVFIGAVNRLYQLNSNLTLVQNYTTGPKYDSPECPILGNCAPNVTKKLTNNYNKALVIDSSTKNIRLISCGSIFQGSCLVHNNISNISNQIDQIYQPVVANDETSSTVVFIGQGPSTQSSSSVLYVGATITSNESPYRLEVPMIASRSLRSDSMLKIAEENVDSGTKLMALSHTRYFVNYVYGFSSSFFTYFLITQTKSKALPYVSKLVRICNEDVKYFSYTEVPIKCNSKKNGRDYNVARAAFVITKLKPEYSKLLGLNTYSSDEVLFVVFSQSEHHENYEYDNPSEHSALCVYSVKAINEVFSQNIEKCITTGGYRGLENIVMAQHCINMSSNINKDEFCKLDFDMKLEGDMPLTATPLATFDNFELTAVAALVMDNQVVVFLGTNHGHLKKIIIKNSSTLIELEDIIIDDSPLNPDLQFDRNTIHLYAMTEKKLVKIKILDCNKYDTCQSCLASQAPQCGWCLLQNECTSEKSCSTNYSKTSSWIHPKKGKCSTITTVIPSIIQREIKEHLEINVDYFPNIKDQLQCIFTFTNKTLITSATHDNIMIQCDTPEPNLIPPLKLGDPNFMTKLSLNTTNHPELVSNYIAFFDCRAYTSCTGCISSPFRCNWCLNKHQCVYSTIQNFNVILSSENCDEQDGRPDVEYCPAILPSSNETNDIIISNGTTQSITFETRIFAQYLKKENFSCRFSIEGRVITVKATLNSEDILQCDEVEFGYLQPEKYSVVDFDILWGEWRALDKPNNTQLMLYKCTEMSPDCGSCLVLEKKFHCGWCEHENQCEVKSYCENGTNWLNRSSTCSKPTIKSFEPLVGSWNDETIVTIDGINLGPGVGEERKITVANVPCIQLNASTKLHTKVVCHVKPSFSYPKNGLLNGPVKIEVGKFSAFSEGNFTFVIPILNNFFPEQGPKSGGTELTIVGKYLDAGNYNFTKVMIHNIFCNISFINFTTLKCFTGRTTQLGIANVTLKFGVNGTDHLCGEFNYTEDPLIDNFNKLIPKGIPAGGIKLHVRGRHFIPVQKALLFVHNEGRTEQYYGKCEIITDDSMNCSTPFMSYYQNSSITADKPKHLDYGFEMDGVQVSCIPSSAKSGSKCEQLKFLLYPNPTFKPFLDNGIKIYNSDQEKHLSIDGENIDLAAQQTDISIKIGSSNCKIESLTSTLITCTLPTLNDKQHEVVIHIGNFSVKVGKLVKETSKGWLLYVGYCCAAVLILIIFALTISYKKSSRSSHNLKKIRKEMDVLEMVVAAESKAAFTDLQTEITDLTTNFTCGGIPFLEYHTYAMNVMFPNEGHSIMLNENAEIIGKEEGLRLFGQLVSNKTFLLLFIQTLESNKDFSVGDRVYVASLVMMTLQNNMGYCTDILKTLLSQLIEKNMRDRRHPKLLFRQSESVVEKMLSIWFAFLLHKFLKEKAGGPLYKLFAAIRQYVNKGPIDAVTCEARHALSEDRMIRQHIREYNTLTVYISISSQTALITGLDPPVEKIPVKVLDCDTISQVKEKAIEVIYSNVHYSARPMSSDFELELVIDEVTGNKKFLSDDDDSSKVEGEWRQQNTLQHYEVTNGNIFNLILVTNRSIRSAISASTMSKLRKFSTDSWKSKVFSRKSNRSWSLSVRARGISYKSWHLIKPVDFTFESCQKNTRNDKMVSEIYLPRLLATKVILQKFVDDLFEAIFDANPEDNGFPPPIKYLFDFLDDQALYYGIIDPDVVHAWKSNCLPLRFWINLIKNPNFVFDIHKSNIVDSCLSVIAQAFMDSCSTSDHHLSRDSPTTKLLYAKEIPINKNKVKKYYSDIKSLPTISDQDMNAMLNEVSNQLACEFNVNSSLYALYEFAVKYNDQLLILLKEDEFAQNQKLVYKLSKVHNLISPELNNV